MPNSSMANSLGASSAISSVSVVGILRATKSRPNRPENYPDAAKPTTTRQTTAERKLRPIQIARSLRRFVARPHAPPPRAVHPPPLAMLAPSSGIGHLSVGRIQNVPLRNQRNGLDSKKKQRECARAQRLPWQGTMSRFVALPFVSSDIQRFSVRRAVSLLVDPNKRRTRRAHRRVDTHDARHHSSSPPRPRGSQAGLSASWLRVAASQRLCPLTLDSPCERHTEPHVVPTIWPDVPFVK